MQVSTEILPNNMFLSQILVLAPLGNPGSDNVIAIDRCLPSQIWKNKSQKRLLPKGLQRVTLACDGLLLKMTMMNLLFIGS